MKLYALLIGINDYPAKPLTQCVGDAGKMEAYLNTVSPSFDEVLIEKLVDKAASRKNIIKGIREFLGQATDEDVALLYYSGHGAQEETAGNFKEEEDGLLECIVCHATGGFTPSQLLADKEIRYLLYSLKNNPHLITLFDACHSGDLVRAFGEEEDATHQVRRIAGAFDARAYDTFVFAGDKKVEHILPDGSVKVEIPFKNHINLSACLSSESSWEDSKGGVFTRYLLKLVETTKGNLTYLDIARWARISMKNITKVKQTPVVTVQGDGKLTAYSSWLNLHPNGVQFPEGFVTNNAKKGWIYSRGSLLGVRKDMEIIISLKHGQTVTAKVGDVDLEESTVTIPDAIAMTMDVHEPSYPAQTVLNTYGKLKVYIHEIDPDPATGKMVSDILSTYTNVAQTDAAEADFYINIFNQLIYFSLPEHDFEPLARQIVVDTKEKVLPQLNEQILSFIKWQHFFTLENPGQDFDTCPIRVNLTCNNKKPADVTNGTIRLEPYDRNGDNELYQEMEIVVENISRETIYVGVLTLGSDLSISSNPFDDLVIELAPGQTKKFYDQPGDAATISLDKYKEIYNWKEEWFYYKFIFNNFEDFSTSIQNGDFRQPALPPPRIYSPDGDDRDQDRGEGSKLNTVRKKWGTARTRIELANTNYNIPSGDLLTYATEYGNSPILAPFIKELYFEDASGRKKQPLRLKQNKNESADMANKDTNNVVVKLMNFIYKTSRRRKFNHQRHTTGPVVIAEGDSWFLYPKPGVRDTLDYIMDKFRLLSLAEAGDEIADYLKNNELVKAVKDHHPKYVLISGGGNDILGEEVRDILIQNVQNGTEVQDYLNQPAFQKKLDFLSAGYAYFLEEIVKLQPEVTVFIHGYDYIRSNPDQRTIKKGWANRYMIEAGILDPALRKKIIYFLVDSFNDLLIGLSKKYPHTTYIDNRSTVAEDEWMDEIHPNNSGFQKVANHFLALMP